MRRLASMVLLATAGCEGTIALPITSPLDPRPPTQRAPSNPADIPELPPVALCQAAAVGRGYLGLGGEHLEAGRADAAAFADIHRPYRNVMYLADWQLMRDVFGDIASGGEMQDPEARDPAVGAAFGVVPDGWYQESQVGPFAVTVTFNYAFKACLRAFDAFSYSNKTGWYEYTRSAPTPEHAAQFCRRSQTAAWGRAPTPAELDACVELAMNLDEEPDVKRRWGYVCASIIASANWLSN